MERTLPQPDLGMMYKKFDSMGEFFVNFSFAFIEDMKRLVGSIDALTEQMAALRQETRQEFETTQLNMAAFQEELRTLTGDIQRGFAEMGTEIQVSSVHDGDVLHEGVSLPFRPR
ncbi:hypothetical protein E4U52_005532 [Claviceps spartinae]|nr:hypothetical protein E4U52_005532 [Claviceps spartinae]